MMLGWFLYAGAWLAIGLGWWRRSLATGTAAVLIAFAAYSLLAAP